MGVCVVIDEGMKLVENPKNITMSSVFGNYSQTFSVENNQLRVRREFLLKTGKYSAEYAKDFFKFLYEVNKSEKNKLLISKP